MCDKDEPKYCKVGFYFNKKILEMLILFGHMGTFGIKVEVTHLHRMANVWPIPNHSFDALKIIFPALARKNIYGAIRCLQKCMHKPPSIVVLTALLCFWTSPKFDWSRWQ